MVQFENKRLPPEPDIAAPDGSDVWLLFALAGRGIAHYELALGKASQDRLPQDCGAATE